jgi:hypothetical protein
MNRTIKEEARENCGYFASFGFGDLKVTLSYDSLPKNKKI